MVTTAGFNPAYGLFAGPSFFNDGIAGYPAPPADDTESVSTGSMPWPGVATAERGAVTVRYADANDDSRTMTLSVDGRPVRQVGFPKVSGSWDDWGTVTFGDLPVSGRDPVVTLSYEPGDTGAINLDWLEYRRATG